MSSELQPAALLTLPDGGLDSHLVLILGIMLLTGALGGLANAFLVDRQPGRHEWLKYGVLGIVAALTVPLFLNMMSSTLLEGARTKPVDFFAFAGFCLVYVIASRRFVDNMVHRLSGQLDQMRREVVQLKQQKPQESVVMPARPEAPPAAPALPATPEPRELLSYNDIEVLRALAEESFVYGNLAGLCERTGLGRDFVSQRLPVLKAIGVIETRINDKNVLHWGVSVRGKAVLAEIQAAQENRKSA